MEKIVSNNFDFEDDRRSFSFEVFEERDYWDHSNPGLNEFRDKLLSFIEKETEAIENIAPLLLNGENEKARFESIGKVKILTKLTEWLENN